MKKILSLCGGGTSGYMTACILSHIEREIDRPINEEFDLVIGVSTGSIIGSLLLSNYHPDDIKDAYKRFYHNVFKKKKPYWLTLFGTLYDNESLRSSMINLIGEYPVSSLSKNFMTYAIQLDSPELKPCFWKSWESNYRICDAVAASCCAPILFKPINVNGKHYFDGGLILNDPSIFAYTDAKKLWEDDIKLLCIQTDHHKGFKEPSKLSNLYNTGTNLTSISTDSGERSVQYICKNLMGDNYLNLLPNIALPLESNDWVTMENESLNVINKNIKGITSFFSDP